MADFADDPGGELRRKAATLVWVAAVEAATYTLLLFFMFQHYALGGSRTGILLIGGLHGFVALAFAGMVVLITPEMRWSWWFAALVILTGPIGAVVVAVRIKRDGLPAPALP